MGATGGATDIYGVAKSTWPLATNFLGSAADSLGNRGSTESFQTGTGIAVVGGAGFGATEVVGTVLMYALDIDAGKLWHGRNGTWRNSGNPGAGTGHSFTISAGTWYPAASIYDATTSKIRLRTKTADFSHSVPSGFSAWG